MDDWIMLDAEMAMMDDQLQGHSEFIISIIC